jgi:thioredoxin reductase (NADPH)
MSDVIIIGGGPAGLAVANTLQEAGLDCIIYEKGALADAVARFPTFMKWFSTAANLELSDYPLIITDEKPTREEYLNYLRRFVQNKNLRIFTYHEVKHVKALGDSSGCSSFEVSGVDQWGERFAATSRYVVVANGAFDHPQRLGIPGEELPKVSHYFQEVHPYVNTKVAVVGGRSSAVETALLLFRAGAEVTMIHRGPNIGPVKYWLQPDIENRLKCGDIAGYLNSHLSEIRRHEIVIETPHGQSVLPNDYVLLMTGYQPDIALLTEMGIEIEPVTKRPKHDPATLESNVPGIYIAGVITAGNISSEVFIENSRHHGELILNSIKAKKQKCEC